MRARRSPAAQVAFVMLVWTLVVQVLSPFGLWFFITRGGPSFLFLGAVLGGGLFGLLGIPFTMGAIAALSRGDPYRAGTRALIGALVAGFSYAGIAAAMFALFAPESRAGERYPDGEAVVPAQADEAPAEMTGRSGDARERSADIA